MLNAKWGRPSRLDCLSFCLLHFSYFISESGPLRIVDPSYHAPHLFHLRSPRAPRRPRPCRRAHPRRRARARQLPIGRIRAVVPHTNDRKSVGATGTEGPSGGGTGHAVAAHQTGNDTYNFFDPNFGIYRYDLTNLMHCLQHLFWTPYCRAEPGTLDGDKAVYMRRDRESDPPSPAWNKVAYTVFGCA